MRAYSFIGTDQKDEGIEKLRTELCKLIGENKALRDIAGLRQRQYITDTKDKECIVIDIHTRQRV